MSTRGGRVCAVCATNCQDRTAGVCSRSCWTRWVGASPTERTVTTAERDARIYGDVAHLGRSPAMVAEEVGLSTRTVWQIVQIVQMRRDALTVDEPALVAPDGEPVGEEWRATIASWGRPGLLLAANLLLLGRVRPHDSHVQHYLGMGEHRLRRMLNELVAAGLACRTRFRSPTGPVWAYQLRLLYS